MFLAEPPVGWPWTIVLFVADALMPLVAAIAAVRLYRSRWRPWTAVGLTSLLYGAYVCVIGSIPFPYSLSWFLMVSCDLSVGSLLFRHVVDKYPPLPRAEYFIFTFLSVSICLSGGPTLVAWLTSRRSAEHER